MILRVCALFDTKTKAFMVPQFFATTDVAVRAVTNAVNDPQAGFLHKNPEDFILFHLADWDDITGKFETFPIPTNLGLCAAFVSKPTLQWENNDAKNA